MLLRLRKKNLAEILIPIFQIKWMVLETSSTHKCNRSCYRDYLLT